MKKAIKLGLALVMMMLSVVIVITSCAPKAAPTPEAQKTPVAPTPKAAPEKVYKVRFNLVTGPISYGFKETYLDMKADIEKRSNGRLVIDYYTGQALINMREALEGLSRGIADMTYLWTCWYPDTFPLDDLYSLPYKTGMRQYNAIFQALRKDFTDPQWVKNWPDTVHVSTYICGPRGLFTRSKPVYKYEDIKGMSVFTITAPDNDLYKSLGASTIAGWAGAEAYELMAKGALEANGTSAAGVAFSYKFYELGKPGYFMEMGGTGCGTCNTAANRKWFESLPQDLQQLLLERVQYHFDASGDNGDMLQYKLGLKQNVEAYAWLKVNSPTTVLINWSDAEKARFRQDKVEPLWQEWAKRADATGYPGTEYLAAHKALIPEMDAKYPQLKEIDGLSTYVEKLGVYFSDIY